MKKKKKHLSKSEKNWKERMSEPLKAFVLTEEEMNQLRKEGRI